MIGECVEHGTRATRIIWARAFPGIHSCLADGNEGKDCRDDIVG